MRRVVIESPFRGSTKAEADRNLRYLRAAMADCLSRGEAPFCSHGLYTQPGVLRDEDPDERSAGIQAGFAWGAVAEACVVYEDLGISEGMRLGIDAATQNGVPVEYRSLSGWARGTQDSVNEAKFWQAATGAILRLIESSGDERMCLLAYQIVNSRHGPTFDAALPAKVDPMTPGMLAVLSERRKQIARWGIKHDKSVHEDGDLTRAAFVILAAARSALDPGAHDSQDTVPPPEWALEYAANNKGNPRRLIIVAAALLAAEIDRETAR